MLQASLFLLLLPVPSSTASSQPDCITDQRLCDNLLPIRLMIGAIDGIICTSNLSNSITFLHQQLGLASARQAMTFIKWICPKEQQDELEKASKLGTGNAAPSPYSSSLDQALVDERNYLPIWTLYYESNPQLICFVTQETVIPVFVAHILVRGIQAALQNFLNRLAECRLALDLDQVKDYFVALFDQHIAKLSSRLKAEVHRLGLYTGMDIIRYLSFLERERVQQERIAQEERQIQEIERQRMQEAEALHAKEVQEQLRLQEELRVQTDNLVQQKQVFEQLTVLAEEEEEQSMFIVGSIGVAAVAVIVVAVYVTVSN